MLELYLVNVTITFLAELDNSFSFEKIPFRSVFSGLCSSSSVMVKNSADMRV